MASQQFRRVLEDAFDCKVTASVRPEADSRAATWFDVHVGGDTWQLAVEHKTAPGSAVGRIRVHQDEVRAQWPHAVPILAVPRLSKKERQALSAHGVNHMDLAGHVWIRAPGLLVQTEGGRPAPLHRQGKGRNPFSKKASLVSRVLLEHPSAHWRVRDLADEASLSVGYASEVLRSLVERGYAAETSDGYGLKDPAALLKEWAGAYRWEDNRIHSFVAPLGKAKLVTEGCRLLRKERVECLLTLLSAVDRLMGLVEHDQVHVYVRELTRDAVIAIRSGLHAESVQRGGNLHVLEPYYGDAAWYGAEQVDGMSYVSDVQLFLDLIHYPVRGPEAAHVLLKKRLGPRLGLSAPQLKTLRDGVGL
jgi:hypothetical protein